MRAHVVAGLLALSASLATADRLGAQGMHGIPIGARVRVTSDSLRIERWETRLERAQGDTLFFAQREGPPFPVRLHQIDRLEASEGLGRSRSAKAMQVGYWYLGGVLLGGAIGAAVSKDPGETLEGSAVLGLFTAAVAYREPLIGRAERWRQIPLPQVSVRPVPATGASVAIGFRVGR